MAGQSIPGNAPARPLGKTTRASRASNGKRARKDSDDEAAEASVPTKRVRTKRVPAKKTSEEEIIRSKTIGQPEVWAEKRQGLCSSLFYYQAYQSAAYTQKKIIKGLLLDGFPGERQVIDSRGHAIVGIGGGRDAKDDKGKLIRSTDQSTKNPMYESAENTLENKQYLALISGQRNPTMTSVMPHAYNVLGWYFITDMWSERDVNGFVIHKTKLQVIDLDLKPWWTPIEEEHTTLPSVGEFQPDLDTCTTCDKESKKVFTNGWVCLNHGCDKFFDFGDNVDRPLVYDEKFLKERQAYTGADPDPKEAKDGELGPRRFPPPLVPPLPKMQPGMHGTEEDLRSGIVCPECGGCSSRTGWKGWVYETIGCDFRLSYDMQSYPIANVRQENAKYAEGKNEKFLDNMGEMKVKLVIGGYKVTIYPLPNLRGKFKKGGENHDDKEIVGFVTHMRPINNNVLEGENGADQAFDGLYSDAARDEWKRFASRHKGLKSEVLIRHWVQNYGAQYGYHVDVPSIAFADASDTILSAHKRLEWAGMRAVRAGMDALKKLPDGYYKSESLELDYRLNNELLALGYFENDRIGYHDDGEDTLGPTVATWSLGSPAKMNFCIKNDPKRGGLIGLNLLHGDFVVMHGAKIHKTWLHEVVPDGNRRFALTARHILIDKMPEDRRAIAEVQGRVPTRAEHFVYEGF